MFRTLRGHACRLTTARRFGIVFVLACGGGTSAAPPNLPPSSNITSIVVTPTLLNLLVGGSGGLGATAYNSAGSPISGVVFAWTSTAPATATVNTSGVVTGVSVGTTNVTASAGGVLGAAVVTVMNPPVLVVSLQIGPPARVRPSAGMSPSP